MQDKGKGTVVVVVGGANYDYLARAQKLPRPGETVQGRDLHEAPGGKGANQAVAVARLGVESALVSRIGSDKRGELIRESLRQENVGVDHLLVGRGDESGVALIFVGDDAEKQIIAVPGAYRKMGIEDIRRARKTIERASVLLLQLEVPMPVAYEAIAVAKKAGVEIILDAAPASPLARDLLAELDVIRANALEAEVMTRVAVKDRVSARAAAQELLDAGVGAVVIQAGEHGDLLARNGEPDVFLPRIQVESIDATGAGDAFVGALGAMRAMGRPLEEAVRYASAAAAFATTRIGAQAGLPSMEDLRALLAKAEAA